MKGHSGIKRDTHIHTYIPNKAYKQTGTYTHKHSSKYEQHLNDKHTCKEKNMQ